MIRRGQNLEGPPGRYRRIGAVVRVGPYALFLTVRGPRPAPKKVRVDGIRCPLLREEPGLNVAVYAFEFPEIVEPDEIAEPELGEATLEAGDEYPCRIEDVDRNNLRITIPSYLPRPGDAGAPIVQNDRVVGMLASYWLNDMLGMGPRADVALREIVDYLRRRTRSSTA
ncbi:hypothetical protein [Methanopyrus kandleri]